jgi:hypothetical protein
MPFVVDLEELRKQHNCINYFETGLWDPRCMVSCRQALSCGFDKVYSIEIKKEWVDLGNEVFKDLIEKGVFSLYHDDSTNMKNYIMTENFNNKTMFFLDAHIDANNIGNYKKKCPLFEELEAIKMIKRNDNVIIIDDLRIIKTAFPWGETSYGNIDFLQQIKEFILTINPNYVFSTLNGHVNDDQLIAYIPN